MVDVCRPIFWSLESSIYNSFCWILLMDDLPKFPNHWHLPGDLQRKPTPKKICGFPGR